MKQIAPLTEVEQMTLTEAYHHHPTFRVRQRAHALLLNQRGYSMARIRELFEVQHETVSRWVHRWEAEGLVGLFDQERKRVTLKQYLAARKVVKHHSNTRNNTLGYSIVMRKYVKAY